MTFQGKVLKRILWAATALIPVAMTTFPSTAQQAKLEEIVVTARKSSETLQSVPLTVTAFSREALEKISPRTLADLNNLSPSLNAQPATGRIGQGRLFMRGTAGGSAGTSKATIFLDGIFLSGNASNVNFAELERVEVIPGPQSAIYGRSTFSGAINYITRDPTETFSVRSNASAASLDDYEASVWVGGPIAGDKLLASATLFYQKFGGSKDWLASDLKTKTNKTVSKSAATKFILQATDDLHIEARANFYRDEDEPTFVHVLSPRNRVGSQGSFSKNVPGIGVIPVYPLGKVHYIPANQFSTVPINPLATETRVRNEGWRTRVGAEWQSEGYTLSLLGAHQFEQTGGGQFGSSQQPNSLISFLGGTRHGLLKLDPMQRVNTLEARLTSPQEASLRYALGVFYENELAARTGALGLTNTCRTICTLTELGSFTINTATQSFNTRNLTKNKAGFGGIFYDVTDQVTASFEGRYQDEYKRNQNFVGNIDFSGNFKKFLPRATLQFKANDDLSFFTVYSIGNNPGNFNTSQFIGQGGTTEAANRKVKEETLENYEVGMKSIWLDERLLFNITFYHMDWKDLQSAATYFNNAGQFYTVNENRGSAKMKGVEFEANAVIAEGLTLRATYSHTDARYSVFCSNNYAVLTDIDDDAGPTNCRFVNGNKIDTVPPTRSSVGFNYEAPVQGDWSWSFRADLQYQSGMYADEFNFAKSYPAWNSNASIGIENDSYNIEVFCKNCTNDKEPIRFVRFSDSRGPGPNASTNQSVGHQTRNPFQYGVRVSIDY